VPPRGANRGRCRCGEIGRPTRTLLRGGRTDSPARPSPAIRLFARGKRNGRRWCFQGTPSENDSALPEKFWALNGLGRSPFTTAGTRSLATLWLEDDLGGGPRCRRSLKREHHQYLSARGGGGRGAGEVVWLWSAFADPFRQYSLMAEAKVFPIQRCQRNRSAATVRFVEWCVVLT
jgi:hypothetical protein